MMDSTAVAYRQAPRPFNKFPFGYRPLGGSSPASPQRNFGSLSSIASTYDNYSRTQPEQFFNSTISLSELNRTYPGALTDPPSSPFIPPRAGSLGPAAESPLANIVGPNDYRPRNYKDDTVYVGSAVSSRAGSPMRATFSPTREAADSSQRSVYSPVRFDIGSPEPRSPNAYINGNSNRQSNFRFHQYEVPPDAQANFQQSNYDNHSHEPNFPKSFPQSNISPYYQQSQPSSAYQQQNQYFTENHNHLPNHQNAYAYSNDANRRADEFLEKLRKQKDEIERSLIQQQRPKSEIYYQQKLPYDDLMMSPSSQSELSSHHNEDYFDERPRYAHHYSQQFHNRQPLHKTVSDPAVQPSSLNHHHLNYMPPSPRRQNLMTQSYDESASRQNLFEDYSAQNSDLSRSAINGRRRYGSLMEDEHSNGLLGASIQRQQQQNQMSDELASRRDGFFANRLIDANWMTDPPPPIDMMPRLRSLNDQQKPQFDPSYQNTIPQQRRSHLPQPIQLDDNRILKIYDPQPSPVREDYHQEQQQQQQEMRQSRLPVPMHEQYRHDRNPPHIEINTDYHEQPRHNYRDLSNMPVPQNDFYQTQMQQQMQQRRATPPPAAYLEPEVRERLPSPRQQRQQRIFDSDYNNHQPLVTTYRNPAYHQNSTQNRVQQRQTPKIVENMFGPVESKIFEASSPTIINGFTTQGQPTTKLQNDRQNAFHNPNASSSSSARTFALVSRIPIDDSTKLLQPLQIQPEDNNHRQSSGKLTDLSPTSIYDNDATDSDATRSPQESKNTTTSSSSEEDQRPPPIDEELTRILATQQQQQLPSSALGHQSRSRIPQPRVSQIINANSMQPARSRSPNGILKKGITPRSNKKVVFQCEPEKTNQQHHLGFRKDNTLNMINGKAPVSGGSAEAPPHVRAFDDALQEPLAKWYALSDQLGGDVTQAKTKVESVIADLRTFLWTAAGRGEPAQAEVQNMLAPIVKGLGDIASFKDSKRNTPMFNHLSAVAEGIPAVGWVLVKKTPAPYVKEMLDAAMFYVNRILKEFKEGDQTHVEWARAWKEMLEEMQKFVRQTHTTGLVWNSAPGSVPDTAAAAPKPAAGGPAPPPPPPPPPANIFADMPKESATSAAGTDKASRDALFAQLNRGEAVTSGLKKVTADMQTHKNPSLRAGSTVSATSTVASSPGGSPVKSPAQPVKKPPKTELQDGKSWIVEYHTGNPNIEISVTDKKQTVYVFRCENCVIKVSGKCNSITLDGCKKTSVVFDALVAQCETINCQSVQIQTLGEMPTLSIQKTDGCQVYLSEAAKNAEIVTSKSSEMNILIPVGSDGDYQEFPVPEQFKTTFHNGKLVTEVSDIV